MISSSVIGLTIIIIAWILQFVFMDKKKKIYPSFIIVYAIGVLILVYDGFSSGLNDLAIANLFSIIASIAVLIKLKLY